jgi:acid phosphatase
MKNHFTIFNLLLIGIFFASCSPTLLNLTTAKKNVVEYYESGKFDEEAKEAVDEAIAHFEKINFEKNAAVVFDVDETALSNYEFNTRYDFGYASDLWDAWIKEAKATAIPQVKSLYDFLISKGAKIIFMTGRKDYHNEDTHKNLVAQGYTKFDTLITRSVNEYKLNAVEYKSAKRTELTRKGYTIIGTVGDQYSDLQGEFHGYQVKIPNYQYLIE